MQTIFQLLETHYTAPARCAAALGMSRQAYHQARTRRRLSDRAAIRAAALLDLDAGALLLANATASNPPAPVLDPTPNLPREPLPNSDGLYYVKSSAHKKQAECRDEKKANIHNITSQSQKDSIDLIRWVYAVAKYPADSPRFNYYVSRWRVPEKIAAAKLAGTFEDSVKQCPPIDPAWIRFVPAALAEYQAFITPQPRPPANIRASSIQDRPARNRQRRAA